MAKYLKKFTTREAYLDYIYGNNAVAPNVSICDEIVDFVDYHCVPIITLTITLSQAGSERISHAGDLRILGGGSDDDGLANVSKIIIDGREIDMETDLTKSVIFNAYGTIYGYFYDFGASGTYTITYVLKNVDIQEFMFLLVGSVEYEGLTFSSNITNMQVAINFISSINNRAFMLSGITDIDIPKGTIGIWQNSFYGCGSLVNVTIPDSVTSIDPRAFSNCTSLVNINIPDGITRIDDSVFLNCTSLTSVNIPSSVTIIDRYAFCGCRGLTSITVPSSVTTINEGAFDGCAYLVSATILATTPPTLNISGEAIFDDCSSLAHIYVPSASVNTYKAATGWSEYASIIEAIP